jgi:multiple sugar transport system permease protein
VRARTRGPQFAVGRWSFMDATTETSWGSMFAMSVVALVPVFLIGQRFLVRGIATTGIE